MNYFIAVMLVGILCLAAMFVVVEWTDSNLEFVLSELKGRDVQVPYVLSAAVTVVSGGVCIPFNILCEVYKLCCNDIEPTGVME